MNYKQNITDLEILLSIICVVSEIYHTPPWREFVKASPPSPRTSNFLPYQLYLTLPPPPPSLPSRISNSLHGRLWIFHNTLYHSKGAFNYSAWKIWKLLCGWGVGELLNISTVFMVDIFSDFHESHEICTCLYASRSKIFPDVSVGSRGIQKSAPTKRIISLWWTGRASRPRQLGVGEVLWW